MYAGHLYGCIEAEDSVPYRLFWQWCMVLVTSTTSGNRNLNILETLQIQVFGQLSQQRDALKVLTIGVLEIELSFFGAGHKDYLYLSSSQCRGTMKTGSLSHVAPTRLPEYVVGYPV
jgi:hypothetical protein